jgi:hypothetical protein
VVKGLRYFKRTKGVTVTSYRAKKETAMSMKETKVREGKGERGRLK